MSLYDIIDDISERQATKTETGDNRIYGVMVGIVAKNSDPNSQKGGKEGGTNGETAMDGRVCVDIPTRDGHKPVSGDDNLGCCLKWARVAMPYGGDKWGHHFLPEIGDQVLLAFEGGNIEKPYVIGCIPKATGFPSELLDKDNKTKAIVTREGNKLVFTDAASGEDIKKKDKIQLSTGGDVFSLLMDNENEKLCIRGKEDSDFITIESKEQQGAITIQCRSNMTLKVGDNINVTMNGGSGKITITANELEIKGNKGVTIKSDATLNIEGANVKAAATSSLTLQCDNGISKLTGSAVQVG